MGYLDDNPALAGQSFIDLPVLGAIDRLGDIPREAVVVAIGDNKTRQTMFDNLQRQGEHFVTACHPRAIIAPGVVIGPGCMVCAGVIVNPASIIGANTILNTGCTLDHHNRIGAHSHIAPGAHLGGEVTVGQGALDTFYTAIGIGGFWTDVIGTVSAGDGE
ncbi:MAG TPA: hypothetical protein VJL59_10910 [Anaerolineales bacterium]|nr:hypothetical protein [Anaerolineales bacterium]